jgi:hypothetical protein
MDLSIGINIKNKRKIMGLTQDKFATHAIQRRLLRYQFKRYLY